MIFAIFGLCFFSPFCDVSHQIFRRRKVVLSLKINEIRISADDISINYGNYYLLKDMCGCEYKKLEN